MFVFVKIFSRISPRIVAAICPAFVLQSIALRDEEASSVSTSHVLYGLGAKPFPGLSPRQSRWNLKCFNFHVTDPKFWPNRRFRKSRDFVERANNSRARASWTWTLRQVILSEKNFPGRLACTIRSDMHFSWFWKLFDEILRRDREISSFLWNYFREFLLAFSPRFVPVYVL